MSTIPLSQDCQNAITDITGEMEPYCRKVTNSLQQTKKLISLQLSRSLLPLFAAYFSPIPNPKILIIDASLSDLHEIHEALNAWNKLFAINQEWHLIAGALTNQEIDGYVYTNTSIALHQLLYASGSQRHDSGFSHLRQVRGSGEYRTEPYQAYGEGGTEPLTKKLAKPSGPAASQSPAWPGLKAASAKVLNYLMPLTIVDQSIPSPTEYKKLITRLTIGERWQMLELIQHLVDRGYVRHQQDLEPGSLRVRGEQIDIAHPLLAGYYTIAYSGQTIESMTHHVGRRSQTITSLALPPAKFPKARLPLHEVLTSFAVIRPSHANHINGQHTIIFDSLTPTEEFPFREAASLQQGIANINCYVFYQNLDRVRYAVQNYQPQQVSYCRSPLATSRLNLVSPSFSLISERDLFPPTTPHHHPAPISRQRAIELISQLKIGKPAVHSDHGIAIFEGLQTRELSGAARDYLVLRYAQGDSLSVPVEFAHKVTPYIGDTAPAIHRLDGLAWAKARRRAQHDAAAYARELLATARRRAGHSRPSFLIDDMFEQTLDETFPYELTPDQERTWQEIKYDLTRQTPMDRLVVGDVGFGKTEIAVRAAAHVAASGKQVALLAPTTLLVQQHFDTLRERLPHLKQKIGMLSRFATTSQQRRVRQAIATGELSIVIGTHALLSPHTKWEGLGLVIIDEEQRFGVKQKEYFKKIRAKVDILSLSATPIPRTLSMALSGLRQLSVITTPPRGRQDIQTHVSPDSDEIIKKALKTELARGGQIYAVTPKIQELSALKERLAILAPGSRIAIAHGQLAPRELSDIMHQFDTGRLDILVASSIVEHGLDLPNANTLLVWRATHFGLADLYQLRGRIGRRDQQGYAYFLYGQQQLTSIQRQRLTALTEASRLGSGWQLARRDLEIRGAGNLLGAEQSGSVNAVGVQLYLDLVDQIIDQEQGHPYPVQDIDIGLPLTATLPPHYIADIEERTRWYQRLTRTPSLAQLASRVAELEQSYGPLPSEAQNFVLILKLQRAAAGAGITNITSRTISPSDEKPYARIEITTKDPLRTLKLLQPLGNWVVRNETISLDMDEITAKIIKQIIAACQTKTHPTSLPPSLKLRRTRKLRGTRNAKRKTD